VGVLYAKKYVENVRNIKRDVFFPFRAFLIGLYTGFIQGYVQKRDFGSTVTGVELTDKLCELAERKGYNVFFLGGSLSEDGKGSVGYEMAVDVGRIMKTKYPKLNVIGAVSRFSREPKDDRATLEYIHRKMKEKNVDKIDILIVAYGPIAQEKWIERNKNMIPATISMGVGRVFNYISGYLKKPPKIIPLLHLEWLYTLIIKPRRMKRVFTSVVLFPLKVYLSLLK
jgi:N-acetylglucosaminyldiphosphoundecaprenol N-acetyl-beta-D-mannosaminyltransferase